MKFIKKLFKMAKKLKPLGLERIYFDVKNKIECLEVLRETSDGTIVCWDPEAETPVPFKRSDFQRQEGGYWATEEEAARSAVKRMQKYITECEAEIELFSKLF